MFFLAATLVGWIGGDFVYRKVAAKNIFLQKRLNRSRYHWNKEPCIRWAQISMETVNFEWDMCPTTLGQWTRPVFGRNPTSRNDATGESCSSDALWRRCFCGTSLLLFVVVVIFYFFVFCAGTEMMMIMIMMMMMMMTLIIVNLFCQRFAVFSWILLLTATHRKIP